VVGVLLGSTHRGTVDCTNSFGVPFEEDLKNPSVWFLDHSYLSNMNDMFRKISAKERIVGFYSTGPLVRENDMMIYDLMKTFCPNPVLVIIDVRSGIKELPLTSFSVETEVAVSGKEISPQFVHVPSSVQAMEAEEVGVEHLLRDINDPTVSSVAKRVTSKITGMNVLREKLLEIKDYLDAVLAGKLVANNKIMYNIQSIFNLMPNLNNAALTTSLLTSANDSHLVLYIGSLIRTVGVLHDLVRNRVKEKREGEEGEEEEKKQEEAKEKGEKKKEEAAKEKAKD
jgi:26S proteasome regulatory subunit N8